MKKVINQLVRMYVVFIFFLGICGLSSYAGDIKNMEIFSNAKTIFQTSSKYDPRLGIAADAVIIHQHGNDWPTIAEVIGSWKQQGFPIGRMFFANSDSGNIYCSGKWDGKVHIEDAEQNSKGEVVKCGDVRPYMVPTEGWINYLEDMTNKSLAIGVEAIMPEEPLAHVDTGYEKSFHQLWLERYGYPWQPENASHQARFLTAQLKNELYLKLEKRLMELTKKTARSENRPISFILPIHSLYGNIAANLVAPLGTSAGLGAIDGYIGQVWTGPANWSLAQYDSPKKSFFASAYALYDYFNELTVESDKKLWLVVDPVEDDPKHTWAEFRQWYENCVAAMLLMDEVDSYEVMPWPDRIYLPGHLTGGGTPAPKDYRVTILAVTQALQEIPRAGQWLIDSESRPTEGIGVAVSDTMMWEKEPEPKLQGAYGLLLPLLEQGVPVCSFVMERCHDKAYTSRFKTILLCYENWKPLNEAMNLEMVNWVRQGGVLVLLGQSGDELDKCTDFWWHKLGYTCPLDHLYTKLGGEGKGDKDCSWKLEKGFVIRRCISPRQFANPVTASEVYLPLVNLAMQKTGQKQGLETPGVFCMRRGPFIIAHSESKPLTIPGKLVDIFDPNLSVRDSAQLSPGSSGLYRDVSNILDSKISKPRILHATHRLMSEKYEDGILRFVVRGPAETPAVVRMFLAGKNPIEIKAYDSKGNKIDTSLSQADATHKLSFDNAPRGVTVEIKLDMEH